MEDALSRKIKLFLTFLAGFLVFSLIFTVIFHYTVGHDVCQMAKSVDSTGINTGMSDIMSAEDTCLTLSERWLMALTTSPLYQPYFWLASLTGGLLSTGIYWRREKE